MTGYDVIAYVTWVGKMTSLNISPEFVSCAIIWYKDVPRETSIEKKLKANQF